MRIVTGLCVLLLSVAATYLSAQISLTVTINNANISTDCGDIVGAPDPLFEVSINGGDWVTYPEVGSCFTDLPNDQFQETYSCVSDVPGTIEVCFRAYENDGIPFSCDINPDCLEEICDVFTLPFTGSGDYSLDLPASGETTGTLDFTISFVSPKS